MSSGRSERPERFFDDGLQQERTALAWERTCLSVMAAGVLIARYATVALHPLVGLGGVAVVAVGGLLLFRSARRYEWLHRQLRDGNSPVQRRTLLLCAAAAAVAATLALAVVLLDALA